MPETIAYAAKDKIARITLDRPKQLNALSFKLMDELGEALREADADDGVHVIVLGHNGPHFGAGYDLKED